MKTGLHPRRKRQDRLLKQTHNMPRSTRPAGEIVDYLHMQLCWRKMNEEHLAGDGMWERDVTGPCYTNTWVCWGIRGGCCFRRGRRESRNCFHPPYRFQLSVQNVPRCHQARPEASVVHQQLSAPADWASLSICRVIASNQGPQQTNSDRYSHLGFTLGQLWCHPKGGTERGKPAVSNVCRVSARPGWQQHERLSQETSVLLSHSAAGQSIWLQCCANSINSYLPFRSYYAE